MSRNNANVVLSTPSNVFSYSAMALDFEDAIIKLTNGRRVVPEYGASRLVRRFSAPNTRYARLIDLVPKKPYKLEADVMWVILMGAGDFPLLWSKGWDRYVGKTVLYIFDTFTSHLPSLHKLLASARWDVLVTSFPDSVPMLERETRRKWHCVVQGINPDRFFPEMQNDPCIAFSSYGRKESRVHEAVKRFAREKGLHYDYTTTNQALQPDIDPRDHYDIYSWHVRNSWFTFSWSVETTNPDKERFFSPLTCRWFEAAASGTTILGDTPKDQMFAQLFGHDLVTKIDPNLNDHQLRSELQKLWESRRAFKENAALIRQKRLEQWTWESRAREIISIAEKG